VATVYNRYIGNTGRVIRVYDTPRQETASASPASPSARAAARGERRGGGGIAGLLGKILPRGIEAGDIVLLLLFLFLFMESGDEEFLIILAILVLGGLK
jgi:hypothetical protein